jgi:FkbM family methyltransferase
MKNTFTRFGREFTFFIDNEEDTIQRCHSKGFFYEEDELLDLRLTVPNMAVIVDIGTNVGNHSVFFAKVFEAKKVICFEPNPKAIAILTENIILNNAQNICDLTYLGIALGNSDSKGFIHLAEHMQDNLGAGTFIEADGGEITITAGDKLLSSLECIDAIKIDVEGLELRVLDGLLETVNKFRPLLYVEVTNSNLSGFEKFLNIARYRIDRTHSRHRGQCNYLCMPMAL